MGAETEESTEGVSMLTEELGKNVQLERGMREGITDGAPCPRRREELGPNLQAGSCQEERNVCFRRKKGRVRVMLQHEGAWRELKGISILALLLSLGTRRMVSCSEGLGSVEARGHWRGLERAAVEGREGTSAQPWKGPV